MPPIIRALLLTDLVDSTRLVETLGDARAAEVFAAHDRVARDLLDAHGGLEIDRTDGFLLLFESSSQAASYAVAYHQAVAKLGRELDVALSGRAGIHEGEVILRENAPADIARGAKPLEVEGIAKPVAARVMSVAISGQTLMTAQAREALGKTTMRVQSHGHWRMRGIKEPIELFEIGDDASPWQPPGDGAKAYRVVERHDIWVPRRDVRCSLPAESDAFVGRSEDLDALATLVHGSARLVTLIGTGGTGKTRLARRFAWTWLGDYPGGAWYCDLSESRSMDGICGAVARALDVPLGKDDPVVQLGHAIAARGPCLVILDNFEQVTGDAAATVGKWVERASAAVFVVTSRERLALPTEHLVPVEPLAEDSAIRLFEARARAQDPKFAVTDANRADVTAIVKTLDGLPLAIELAAARIRVLPPAQLRERLKERFKVLAGARGAAKRQATLLAAIDWSWDLLAPWEKASLAQCSAFAGGFTLGAAEAVLDLDAWPEAPPPMDVVHALLDKSLLRTWTPEVRGRYAIEEPYFGMYMSIHEYASEKLRLDGRLLGGASGIAAERVAFERHGSYYARFGAEEALAVLGTHGGVALRQALALELENLVAACRRAVGRGDGPTAVATLAAAGTVLGIKGPFGLGVELARQVLGLGTLQPADRCGTLRILAGALRNAGRMDEARRHQEEALAITRQAGNRRSEGAILGSLGVLHLNQGRMDEALQCYQSALAIHRELGDRAAEGSVFDNLGLLHMKQARMEDALRHYNEALAISREVGGRGVEGSVLANLGVLHEDQGRIEQALQHFEEALVIHREVGNRRDEGIVLGNLGNVHHAQGRLPDAWRLYQAALTAHREVGNGRAEGIVLGRLGVLHLGQGRMDEARTALAAGEVLLRAAGAQLDLGRLLCHRGECERLAGDLSAAREQLAGAEGLARDLALGPDSEIGREIGRLRAAVDASSAPPRD